MVDCLALKQTSECVDVEHRTLGRAGCRRSAEREATTALPLKGPDDPLSRATIEAHNLTHSQLLRGAKSVFRLEGKAIGALESSTTVRYRASKWTFSTGVGVWSPEAHATSTALTLVDMDTGYVGVLMATRKSPTIFMVGSTASLMDKMRAEKTGLRNDNELAMRQLAERTATFRHPWSTFLEPISPAEHQRVGGVERAQQSMQAARALRTDSRTMGAETLREIRAGTCHKSPLLLAVEACMVSVPIESAGLEETGCAMDEGNLGWEARRE